MKETLITILIIALLLFMAFYLGGCVVALMYTFLKLAIGLAIIAVLTIIYIISRLLP